MLKEDIIEQINELLEELDSTLPAPIDANDVETDDPELIRAAQQHVIAALGHGQAVAFHFSQILNLLGLDCEDVFEDDEDDDDDEEEDDEETY